MEMKTRSGLKVGNPDDENSITESTSGEDSATAIREQVIQLIEKNDQVTPDLARDLLASGGAPKSARKSRRSRMLQVQEINSEKVLKVTEDEVGELDRATHEEIKNEVNEMIDFHLSSSGKLKAPELARKLLRTSLTKTQTTTISTTKHVITENSSSISVSTTSGDQESPPTTTDKSEIQGVTDVSKTESEELKGSSNSTSRIFFIITLLLALIIGAGLIIDWKAYGNAENLFKIQTYLNKYTSLNITLVPQSNSVAVLPETLNSTDGVFDQEDSNVNNETVTVGAGEAEEEEVEVASSLSFDGGDTPIIFMETIPLGHHEEHAPALPNAASPTHSAPHSTSIEPETVHSQPPLAKVEADSSGKSEETARLLEPAVTTATHTGTKSQPVNGTITSYEQADTNSKDSHRKVIRRGFWSKLRGILIGGPVTAVKKIFSIIKFIVLAK